MRYPSGHKAETRRRLLQAAGGRAKQKGFAASGVDGLMAAAGLSGAALYGHFKSKDRFFEALLEWELGRTLHLLAGDPQLGREAWLDQVLDAYLSADHVEHPEAGCALPCLSGEVGRAKKPVKQGYEKALAKTVAVLAKRLGDPNKAWAALAQCVGAVALARAVASKQGRTKILESSKNALKRSLKT